MSFFGLWLIVLVVMAGVEAQAQARGAPNFTPGRYLCADNGPILGNNSYSDAEVADWNADGKKDLLVGVFHDGNIWLYLNHGTDEDPVFMDGTLLQADGKPIQVGFG